MFGQFPRCFAGTLLLPLCLLLRPILKFWSVGAALMRFTWANRSQRNFLFSNFSVTRNSPYEFHTLDWSLHVGALPEKRLRRLPCPEIRNPIVVRFLIDVEKIFVPICYHLSRQVALIDRGLGR